LVVHIFGHPVDMESIADVAREFSLEVIEDAAESLGSRYKGKPCGSLARLAALSFNGNKIVTTGGGGAILTSDAGLAERARSLVTTAKRQHRWAFFHDEVAYNFRLPNINAALGLAQVEQLEAALAAKAVLWRRYKDAFYGYPGARIFEDAAFAESNHWLVALLLDAEDLALRDAVLDTLNDEGIGARAAWTPMHELPMYRSNPRGPLPVTESLAARIINLPSSQHLA
jgi:perosamine synthetase